MEKKMNNYYNTKKDENYSYEKLSSKNNQENSEEKDDNFIYENPYQKYLIEKYNKRENCLEMNSSQEEINSKEDIIKIKNEDEIMRSSRGKFRFINAQASEKDKIEKIENLESQNISPNKITNNICIIINKSQDKAIDNSENNINNIEYINTFDKEFKNKNSNKKELNQHKKNNSNKKNKKSEIEPQEEIDNYNYSYIDTEPNEKNKITLHKKLKQKKQKLKDLEQTIQNKKKSLKEKKSKIDMKQNKKHVRSTTFDSGKKNVFIKRNDKDESIIYESLDNKSSRKKKILNLKNNNKSNKNNNENKSINSEDKIFKDIPMIKIEKNKYFEEENVYKTVSMSPDISRDKYNISFNKSIEQKRRLLGIPLYKNEFQKYNKNNINKNKKNNRVEIYKKRQEEILNNYEKKNAINRKSRENLKNNKKSKTPIRITYNDNYNNKRNSNANTYLDINDNKSHKKGNTDEKQKNMNVNHLYIISQKPYIKNKNKRNTKSQNEIEVYDKKNKTQNSTNINNKDQAHNYLKKKIKVYKQKEKSKENKKTKIKNNEDNRYGKELIEYKLVPGKNEIPKEKKVYENNTYYSKIISKMLNFNESESQKNTSNKETKNNSDNKNTSSTKKRNNLNTNNYKDVSPFTSKIIFSSPKQNEIMTIQNNEDGKTMRIVKKRHKSPKKSGQFQNNQLYQNQNQFKILENNKPEKENIKKEKKEYKNNVVLPGRGISALRRINQKIENYKNRVPSRKRRRTKNKNQQYKSLSHLKKIGKHPFGRVKQSKSIKTLPDINKDSYHNFDFIDDI